MQSQTTVKKPKLKIKLNKTKKTKIEDKLNSLYPNSDLFKKELNYDIDIPEEFRKNISIDGEKPDMDIVNSLPKLQLETEIIEDNNDNEVDYSEDNTVKSNDCEDDDIDKDALELELVGSKKYYMDYSKGIIYDLQYKPIGNIDDYGDININ
tara:strand:+ start:737 stop:1192 length:456 start_codon:yes stop_codon:yes gene_type:complete